MSERSWVREWMVLWLPAVLFAGIVVLALAVRGTDSPPPAPQATTTAEDTAPISAAPASATPATPRRTATAPPAAGRHRCLQPDGHSLQFAVAVRRQLEVAAVLPVSTKIVDGDAIMMGFTTVRGGRVRLAAATLLSDCTVRAIAIGE